MTYGRLEEWHQATTISNYPELTTLCKALIVISSLTYQHAESRVGITAIGGVTALVKIMNTFPDCQDLQEDACSALRYLTRCSIAKARAIESGRIEALLATISSHLASVFLCQQAFGALLNIASDSKDNTWLLISLGVVVRPKPSGWMTSAFKHRCEVWPT